MLVENFINDLVNRGRVTDEVNPKSHRGDPKLGVLQQLPGFWTNRGALQGHAWNMIALPFGAPGKLGDFRLLLNQANETLDFDLVDLGVPNRGVNHGDQHLSALRYLQSIDQVAAIDGASDGTPNVVVPATQNTNDTPKGDTLQPGPGVPPGTKVGIHREPGLFFHLANLAGVAPNDQPPGPDVGRIATIPHGDAVLAMGFNGSADPTPGAPDLTNAALKAAFDPLPIGLPTNDLNNPYFGPYKHFHDNPFQNIFDPTDPLKILDGAIAAAFPGSNVIETTTFLVDSTVQGGIHNIPFVIAQANATEVKAVFWIQKVQMKHKVRYVLQYAQRVILEFFPRGDGKPGLIQWPHISVNTMIRQNDDDDDDD